MKRVIGLPGDSVAVDPGRRVFVRGEFVGIAKRHALNGRALEAIGPGVIPPGHYFVPRRSQGQPRQPLRGDRAGAARAHPGPRPPASRHPLAGARRPPRETRGDAAMRRFAAALACALALAAGTAAAKDLGVRGAVWHIEEPDLLTEIENRLETMKASGETRQDTPRGGGNGRRNASRRLPASRESAPRAFSGSAGFDPSVIIERDVRTADGRLIAARGTRINPLEKHPLTRDLLFHRRNAPGRGRMGDCP